MKSIPFLFAFFLQILCITCNKPIVCHSNLKSFLYPLLQCNLLGVFFADANGEMCCALECLLPEENSFEEAIGFKNESENQQPQETGMKSKLIRLISEQNGQCQGHSISEKTKVVETSESFEECLNDTNFNKGTPSSQNKHFNKNTPSSQNKHFNKGTPSSQNTNPSNQMLKSTITTASPTSQTHGHLIKRTLYCSSSLSFFHRSWLQILCGECSSGDCEWLKGLSLQKNANFPTKLYRVLCAGAEWLEVAEYFAEYLWESEEEMTIRN
jgi:hypothetical protein